MGMGRGTTLRSLIEVLDRVIGRGVVVDSDVPVSPVLAGLRRAAQGREPPRALPPDPAGTWVAAAEGTGDDALSPGVEREPDATREVRGDPPPGEEPAAG